MAYALERLVLSTVRCFCVVQKQQEVADAMNEAHFYDLHGDPFSNTSPPAWLFASRGHQAALQALIARLKARQPCVMLLGEAGVGKTFLLHAALAHRELQHLKTVQVWYPILALHNLFTMMCRDLGLEEVSDDTAKMAQ